MLSTMQVASFSQQAAYGHTSTFIRLQDTVQHAVQFGVASCRAATHSKQRNATMLTSDKGPFTLDVTPIRVHRASRKAGILWDQHRHGLFRDVPR